MLIITSIDNELLKNVNIDVDLEWPWTSKIRDLVNFSRFRAATRLWIVPKWLEIDQDNLSMKFSALNVAIW